MRPVDHPSHLTYCLNIHPTQQWREIRDALRGAVREVKRKVSPDAVFPIGLRVSAEALEELQAPQVRAELKELLHTEGYRAVTVNGFPYGNFHGTPVKEAVYQPDWRLDERRRYTQELASLMAELGRPGDTISLSTVPGTFKPLSAGAEPAMTDNLLRSAAHCVELARQSGVTIAIALEPEPECFLETIDETVAFFRDYLFSQAAVERLAKLTGLSLTQAREALPRHLGVCYDVCHAAVEFEDPKASIAALRAADIPIHKLQLSAALRIRSVDANARHALADFNEPTYLHQVVAKGPQGLTRYPDLSNALARQADVDGEEWRIHYHVPIFAASLGIFDTTQAFLAEILALHRRDPISAHLEIETYTWHVLPEALKQSSIEDAIAREIHWVREQLT